MAYLPDDLPLPNTDELDTRVWWEHCAKKELVIQQCAKCKTFRHPPMPVCFNCHSFDFTWTPVEGRGTVHSFTVAHHPVHASLRDRGPYNIVIVDLPHAGVRMIGNAIDVKNDELYVGMPLALTWETRGGVTMPQWKRAT
ncbi:MAG: hypothetical protein FJ315_00140 [SAR202 cluster bacterium]|nr:hypothetical protein [SAR202 cluster bacterium]